MLLSTSRRRSNSSSSSCSSSTTTSRPMAAAMLLLLLLLLDVLLMMMVMTMIISSSSLLSLRGGGSVTAVNAFSSFSSPTTPPSISIRRRSSRSSPPLKFSTSSTSTTALQLQQQQQQQRFNNKKQQEEEQKRRGGRNVVVGAARFRGGGGGGTTRGGKGTTTSTSLDAAITSPLFATAGTAATTTTRLVPALSKFVASLFNPKKLIGAFSVVVGMIFKGGDWKDWILILVLAKSPIYFGRQLYLQNPNYKRKVKSIIQDEDEQEQAEQQDDDDDDDNDKDDDDNTGSDNDEKQKHPPQKVQLLLDALRRSRLDKYEQSKTKRTARAISEIGELFGFLKLTEYALVVMKELGWIASASGGSMHHLVATFVASIWGAHNLSELKSYYLLEYPQLQRQRRGFGGRSSGSSSSSSSSSNSSTAAGAGATSSVNSLRTAKTINRVLNVVIWGVTTLGILEVVSKTKFATGVSSTWSTLIGRFTTSVFGLSGITTLLISLASRELVGQFLASLAIQGTNMYREGEVVSVGNNDIIGFVQKLGVFHTHIRTSDEKIVRVPNAYIASSKRLANVSRQTFSSVQLTLELSYNDMNKVPDLVQDMKDQIEHDVMILTGNEHTIVKDGTRPYRVHWRDVSYRGIQIVIDIHLRMPPNKDLYFDTRQAILIAISKSCSKHDITYAYQDEQVRRMVGSSSTAATTSSTANTFDDISMINGSSSSSSNNSNVLASFGVEDDKN